VGGDGEEKRKERNGKDGFRAGFDRLGIVAVLRCGAWWGLVERVG
jgi:hypothetical protein